ncbi:MAG: cystathionine beta-lyase [Betaproteobacteria bacterium]|nr:cystathionine beta-lyase [Betaproteobacteria bacterium]
MGGAQNTVAAASPSHPAIPSVKKDTILAHAGRDPARYQGMVNTPVFRTSTVLFPTLEAYETRGDDQFSGVRYGRHGTPTTRALEEAVAKLEGGYRAVALPSGLAAIAAAISAFVKSGDHLLVADTVYSPTRSFCDRRLAPNGVAVEYYDPLGGGRIADLIRPDTRAVFCESPGSLTFEMQDIPAIAEAAHARGIPVLSDNTWGTPYFFRSFERGVDVSIHSATKYIVGHADAMAGIIVANKQRWAAVRRTVADFGYSISPDDCYLALRGLRTLGVRLNHQQESALRIARWLAARPEVKRVLYPVLEDDPGHALWKRDFGGAASLFSFVLHPASEKQVAAFVNALELFGIGSSWGGYESLATVARVEKYRTATRPAFGGPVIRLHIGLEDLGDLIADLANGFVQMKTAG